MKEEILKELEKFNKMYGVDFLSQKDAEDYFRGLTTLIESFYVRGKYDCTKELIEVIK